MSCPICSKPTASGYHPFCSRRCADVDLARWFRADYAIPAGQDEPDETPLAFPDDRKKRERD